ncbi:NADH-quinone oxidoreductase subunit N [Candidatus Paracaedibacter symbiosus]|uniref:NADH-quinone oxidoreductase subunit N n=1 Tax=Candidatus Paracaedibacter symbiosus TaxID=244582 RepID=UPI0005098F28|nr:NADH-quinone oxidoreductase subunit N [Candidatus Paracaedibacter symbiosus]
MIIPDMLNLLPELIILAGTLMLLLFAVFIKYEALRVVNTVSIAILFAALSATIITEPTKILLLFTQLVNDEFAHFSKIIILAITTLFAISNRDFVKKDGVDVPEYSVLILLSVLGMMVMVSSQTFLSLFMGLELQSLSLYVLTAIRRDDKKASEAGLKYFLLGSLATGIMLYGMTFIYGAVGSVSFAAIQVFLQGANPAPMGFYLGMAFIIAGIVFKISAVPFHMWTPDVYEGAPTTVVSFFASVPKVAAFCMITRLLAEPMLLAHDQWQYLIAALGVATMIVGVFGALNQKNIKRLLAYSSIMNMGYAMLGLLSHDFYGIESSLIYVTLYAVTVLCFFICLLIINRRGQEIQNITDLAGLFKVYPGIAFVMVFLLFSFAGVPPLAGFLGKLYVFEAVLHADMLPVAIIGVLVSVIAAAYYLYVVKVIVMDEPQEDGVLTLAAGGELKETGALLVTGVIIGGLTWFFIKPEFFLQLALAASKTFFTS